MAALALSLVVLLAGTASAARGWLGPQDLSATGQDVLNPQLALDPAGDAVAVWERADNGKFTVQAAARRAGGRWGPPHDLSADGQNAADPQVALDAAGNAVAVWRHWNGVNDIVQAVVRPTGGKWGAPQDLSAVADGTLDPDVALDPAGDAVVVWTRSNGSNLIAQAAIRPAGGQWGAPQDLSAAGVDALSPQVALDRAGNAVVVWTRSNGSPSVQAVVRPARGQWGAPQNLSAPGANAGGPQVALDPAGNAVAVWGRWKGLNSIVQAARRPAGGAWGQPQDLSAAGGTADGPQVALDPAGNAVVVWWRWNGSNDIVQAAQRSRGGAWGAPQDLSAPGGEARDPHVGLGPARNAVAVWWRSSGTSWTVQASITAPCAVPKLVGKTLTGAKRLIKTNGCHTGKITRVFSTKVTKGRVVRQRPKAGARVAYPGLVSLVVSRGKRR